jgi:hypothetical protein
MIYRISINAYENVTCYLAFPGTINVGIESRWQSNLDTIMQSGYPVMMDTITQYYHASLDCEGGLTLMSMHIERDVASGECISARSTLCRVKPSPIRMLPLSGTQE